MALVPVANGVNDIVAGYGISAIDIGANRFKVAANIDGYEIISDATFIDDPLPAGVTTLILTVNGENSVQLDYTGIYLVQPTIAVGQNAGAPIVIGPSDYLEFSFGPVDGARDVIVPWKPVPRAVGDVAQGFTVTNVHQSQVDEMYEAKITIYNNSGTMTLGGCAVFYTAVSLSGVNNGNPGPPPPFLLR
jgi:hypothetical protein